MTDETTLWTGAVAAQAADITSTMAGLEAGGYEANPLVARAIEAGGVLPGLVGVYVVALALAGATWGGGRRAGWPATWIVPLGMALGGALPALWNLAALHGVVA